MNRVILWGGTGQAKVIRPILHAAGLEIVAVFDEMQWSLSPFPDIPIYRGWEGLTQWLENNKPCGFCVTIGNPHGRSRVRIAANLRAQGFHPVSAIHPQAIVEQSARLGEGCQVHAGAYVGVESKVSPYSIVNTRAIVDHECRVGEGCEVGPGATLCGLVTMGDGAWIGAGATVLPRKNIGADSIVGAGAVVTRDIQPGRIVVGVPAKMQRFHMGIE